MPLPVWLPVPMFLPGGSLSLVPGSFLGGHCPVGLCPGERFLSMREVSVQGNLCPRGGSLSRMGVSVSVQGGLCSMGSLSPIR